MPDDPDNGTDWAAIMRSGVLLVLLLAGFGVWKWNKSRVKFQEPGRQPAATAARPLAVGQYKHLSTLSPLVVGEKAQTADQTRHHLLEWLEKAYHVDGFTPELTLLKNERWKPFAQASAWAACGDPRRLSRRELHSMAQDLARVAEEHPVSAFLVATVLSGETGSFELLEKAVKDFNEGGGNETLAFHAAAALVVAGMDEDDATVTRVREDAALLALRKALAAEGGYAKYHDRVVAFVLMRGSAGSLFELDHERMAEAVANTEAVKPWVKKWIAGLHSLQKGWDMRGGGYGSTVTGDGYAIFKYESEKARRLLREAWEMKPEDPSPAVSLIYSSLSLPKEEAREHMRKWFDEVLRVQVDVPEAAHNYLWGLRPRWYGSHHEMKQLGLACANTERFDSGLPWVLLQAHRDYASEWDVPDAYYKELDPVSYESLRAVFEGAEMEEKRALWRSVDRTQAAVVEFKCGHYDEAQKWLDKLDSKPNAAVLEDWGRLDADLLTGKTAASATGAGSEDLRRAMREAEVAEHAFQAGTAHRLYGAALRAANDKLREAGRKYLESRVAITEIERGLYEERSASLMPDSDFRAWSHHGGGWKHVGKVLTHSGTRRLSSSTCEARVGSAFVVEGDVEISEPGPGYDLWLAYGYPENTERTRWIAVRFIHRNGKTMAVLSNGLGTPLENKEVEVQSRFQFKFTANVDGLSLFVDDEAAFENVPAPSGYVREEWGHVGLGAMTMGDETRVKVHSLTVRR